MATLTRVREILDKNVGTVAAKLSNQTHLASLRNGMVFTLPFTLLGGVALIIMFPPIPDGIDASNPFIGWLAAWKGWGPTAPIITTVYYLTFGLLAVFTVFGIASELAKIRKLNVGYSAMIAITSFLIVAASPTRTDDGLMLPMTGLDATGMFAGIIVAFLSVELTSVLIKRGAKLKLPDAVPPNIISVFEYAVPLAVNAVAFTAANELVKLATGNTIVTVIQGALTPLLSFTDSLGSIIFLNLLVIGFWFFGIHGAAVVASLIGPIQAANLALNASAVQMNEIPEAILAGSFKSIFATQIMFNAMLLAILILAKSPRLRSISKLSFVPSVFNINEPLIFGLPLVLNPVMIIPAIIATVLNTTVSYIAMSTGFLAKVFVATVPTLPSPINAFLSTLDWKAPIIWFALLAVNILIFVPFVRSYDKAVIIEDAEEIAAADPESTTTESATIEPSPGRAPNDNADDHDRDLDRDRANA